MIFKVLSISSCFMKRLHNGEALLPLPRVINWILKAQLQEKLILQFLHIDFYLCHCSLPDNGVSPCSEQSFGSFSKYLELLPMPGSSWELLLGVLIDSKESQAGFGWTLKTILFQGHLPPDQVTPTCP